MHHYCTILYIPRGERMISFAQVLWDLIREQGADEDGDNRISEEEFVRQNSNAVGVESAWT